MNESEDVSIVAQDYFDILKSVYPGKKPTFVALDEDDYDLLIVDGSAYDCADIPHDDQVNTGRRMEIEVLMTEELPVLEIQKELNEKIQREW